MTNEKRNHAIEWITRELGFLRRAPALNGCEMKKEWAEQIEVFEAALEALNDHVREDTKMMDHFPDAAKMVPLTLEQLRGMDGLPVYVKFPRVQSNGFLAIVYSVDIERKELILNNGNLVYGWYGERVIAYDYPPAHIDRELWTAEWLSEDIGEHIRCQCSKCGYPVSYFWGRTAFCPGCGKAMTPEAWAMLEQRLRGGQS